MEKIVRVGVGVFIRKGGKILLGKRKGSHGAGGWCPPGGHLEFGESWEECIERETMEEAGIKIKNVRFGTVTNDIFEEGKHYITICMVADYDSGEVRVLETEKCEKWEWFDWEKDRLPEKLFLPQINLLKQHFDPFEI
jgi:8-oxo-dGTP diphosphatase